MRTLVIAAASVALSSSALATNLRVKGSIEMEHGSADVLTITGWVEAREALTIHGLLLVERSGPSGSFNSTQSNEIAIKACEKHKLAVVAVNVPAGQTASARLLLTADGILISETRASFP